MRVSSLSDARVIALISKYFVPAWVSRDDYQLDPRGKEAAAELERIDADRHKRGLEGGTVCVFVLDPDGGVRATLPVQKASKPANLIPLLEKIVADTKATPRDAEAIMATAAQPPEIKPKTEGGRLVHIWTRCDQPSTNRGLSHDRVELTATEMQAFVPPADAKRGDSWKIPDTIAARLFQYCYPPGPVWSVKESKVRSATLKATLSDETRIQLEGELELHYPNRGKPTDGRITARLVGFARIDAKNKKLTSLALVSAQADYVWYWQDKPQPIKMRIAMELEP